MEITKEYFDQQLGLTKSHLDKQLGLNQKYFDKQFEKLVTKEDFSLEIGGLKGEILGIKTDIVALQDDVRDIKTGLTDVKEIVTNLNKRDMEDSNGFAKILVRHDLEIKRLKLKQV